MLEIIVTICSLVASSLLIFQLIFSFRELKRQKKYNEVETPNISVIIPSFNEDIKNLLQTIDSIKRQNNVNYEIILVDDGSDDKSYLKQIPSEVKTVVLDKNQGKKFAQSNGIKQAKYDWIATVDSDTILHKDSLYNLYKTIKNKNIDAATGTVYLENEKSNLLTRITAQMYWYSFFQDRASQSYFNSLLCCAGALSLYKKSDFITHEDDYLNFSFCGKPYAIGDDRQITNILLLNNKKVGWSSDAIAYTVSPDTNSKFLKQQTRWNRSQLVAMFYSAKNIKKCSFWLIFFSLGLIFRYTYMLAVYAVMAIACIKILSLWPLLILILSLLIVSFGKSIVILLYTKQPSSFYLAVYSLYAFFVLNIVLVYSMFTLHKDGWITRKS